MGSRRSRSQSPSRFIDSTVSIIARPGKRDTHQPLSEVTSSRPSATIRPHAGVGRGMPATPWRWSETEGFDHLFGGPQIAEP